MGAPAPWVRSSTSSTVPHTTATTIAHHIKTPLPDPPHLPWAHVWLLFLALPLLAVLVIANRRMNAQTAPKGGSGKVVGIVGRMGSGKSYMAVRMAYRKLKRGANVVTNFTMNLDGRELVNGYAAQGRKNKWIARELSCQTAFFGGDPFPVGRVRVLRGMTGEWRMFRGWDQFAELENAVVIVDEAHLYAPSNKSMVFPDVARFKMSQARKFRLDVYWITQHENRVNSILKDLTNMMYVCRSFLTGALFAVKGYEPEHMRKKGKHLERLAYRMNTHIAGLYNTLEILAADDHLMKSESMQKAHKVAAGYMARTLKGSARDRAIAAHEGATFGGDAEPVDLTAPPAELAPVVAHAPAVMVDGPPAISTPPAPAVTTTKTVTKPRARKAGATPPRRSASWDRCEHEQASKRRAGTCNVCSPYKTAVKVGGKVVGYE